MAIFANNHVKSIPTQCYHVDAVIRFVENQRSWPTGCITQVDPYHFRISCVSREPDRCEGEGDPDVAEKHPPVVSNLSTVTWFSSQSDGCMNGQEKEHA